MGNGFLERPIAVVGASNDTGTLVDMIGGPEQGNKQSVIDIITAHFDERRVIAYESLAMLRRSIKSDKPLVAFWMLPQTPQKLEVAYALNGDPPQADIARSRELLKVYSPFSLIAIKPTRAAYHLHSPIITVRAKDLPGYLKDRVEPGYRR